MSDIWFTAQVSSKRNPICIGMPGADPHVVPRRTESKHHMEKRQIIDDIRRFNTTAQPQFLAQFDSDALRQYLDHLRSAHEKHVRIAGWVRRPKMRMVS